MGGCHCVSLEFPYKISWRDGKVQSWERGNLIQFHRVELTIIHSLLVSATCCNLGSQWWSFTAHVPSSLDQLAAVAIASAHLLSSWGTWWILSHQSTLLTYRFHKVVHSKHSFWWHGFGCSLNENHTIPTTSISFIIDLAHCIPFRQPVNSPILLDQEGSPPPKHCRK